MSANLRQDLRHALRALGRSPGFSLTVIITLGLGIGANAAMFNAVDRLMFRPLAYLRDPASVHRIYWQWQDRGATTTSLSTQYARYLDLKRGAASFVESAGFAEMLAAVGEGHAARERRVAAVSAEFFDLFDARPVLGRFFTRDEDLTPRGSDVAVLSYASWQTDFGGRNVLGERLRIGNVHATIIGVTPDGFNGVNDADPPVVFIPITTYAGSQGTDDAKTYFTTYRWGWMHVIVRRRPDVTIDRAEAEATEIFRRSWIAAQADQPNSPAVEEARPRALISAVRPGAGPSPSLEARTALWLTLMAAIVLLIACANVANLVLARALGRQRETAVRLALGVGRVRLLAEPALEGLILAMCGGGLALGLASVAGTAIQRLLLATPDASPLVFTDPRTIMVTVALALVTALGVGLLPVLFARRTDIGRRLRGGQRGGVDQGARLRAGLLLVQATLAVVLLIGAALFVRSLDAVRHLPLGYKPDRVLLVNRIIRGPAFTFDAQRSLRESLLRTAESLPGVESAAWMSSAPFVSTSWTALFVDGIESADRVGVFTYQATTPDYFKTMGTRIVRGRGFTMEDRGGMPPVAVVSDSMARALWPGQDAIGKCFRMRERTAPCVTVVGIAEDMVQRDLTGGPRFHYYLSIDQYTRTFGNGLLLRLRGDPAREAETIRAALQRVVPGESYLVARPLADVVASQQRPWQLGATLFMVFGGLALVVAAIGLYGVVAYNVAQRTHEFGVRIALGADRSRLVGLVVGQGVRLAGAGVVLGLTTAGAAGRWIEPLLFRQPAHDPVVFGSIGLLVIAVALFASAWPAHRAASTDPNSALKAE